MFNLAEYLWIDGTEPDPIIRSKARVIHFSKGKEVSLSDFPGWSFDGSSTNQAAGNERRRWHQGNQGCTSLCFILFCAHGRAAG